jgi:aminopeptidase N
MVTFGKSVWNRPKGGLPPIAGHSHSLPVRKGNEIRLWGADIHSPVEKHVLHPTHSFHLSILLVFQMKDLSRRGIQMQTSMTQRLFRYYPEDFGELPVKVLHMDLAFDMQDDRARVHSRFTAENRDTPLQTLALNTKNLEIHSVKGVGRTLTYTYNRENYLLHITFLDPIPPRTRFTIETDTTCHPSRTVLEGLYYDVTPPGAPPQLITQCQQWGFQRLVPCIDDMTAKCTYTTTIRADHRYTNILSNGDITEPRRRIDGQDSIVYENRITPMAPYLFFLGCGTYDTFSREFEYPDGRKCLLELLVPPGSDSSVAAQALDILFDSVMWIHLFTGPGRYAQHEVRKDLYEWVRAREDLKKDGQDTDQLSEIRKKLQEGISSIEPGYIYTGSTYREIGMQNSDFGGMENVGNTTITTNRIMPFPQMTDRAFEYMVKVKVHEYYHNLNGSEVTGRSPFEIWLNEAVTVHVENWYHAFHFGEAYSRLQTVLTLLEPSGGTLVLDRGAASMPVEPDGFNDPNELITDITYVKGPEFVRMIETSMGKEQFVKGLDLYHRRYRHGNASRAQWVEAMEEIAGHDLAVMADRWLKQTGFPVLSVQSSYDEQERALTLHLTQTGFGDGKPWIFPLLIALVDETGKDIANRVHAMEKATDSLIFRGVPRPAFLSLNRGYSFYGKVLHPVDTETLYLQVERDSDLVNRYLAFAAIFDAEKMKLLRDQEAVPDPRSIRLFYRLVSDEALMQEGGGQLLTIFESVPDERFAHHYRALYEAREKILKEIAHTCGDDLLRLYESIDPLDKEPYSFAKEIEGIRHRQVRNTCLSVLARLDTQDIHRKIYTQFKEGVRATDKVTAFGLYMESSAPDKFRIFDQYLQESKQHPVSWETFLGTVGGNSSKDCLALITRAEQSDAFHIEQTNDQRSLYGRFALNRKISLQTPQGRDFLHKTLHKLATVNEFTTVNMLRVFGDIDLMEEEYHLPLAGILASLLRELDPEKTPSVYNTARRILLGAPKAIRKYEEAHGKIQALQGFAQSGKNDHPVSREESFKT